MVCEIAAHCIHLRHLSIANCLWLSDDALRHLSEHLTDLVTLDLSNNSQFSHMAADIILSTRLAKVQILQVRNCSGMIPGNGEEVVWYEELRTQGCVVDTGLCQGFLGSLEERHQMRMDLRGAILGAITRIGGLDVAIRYTAGQSKYPLATYTGMLYGILLPVAAASMCQVALVPARCFARRGLETGVEMGMHLTANLMRALEDKI